MRAVVLREFGPPQRLVAEDLTEPAVERGAALIDVEYAGVTFVETQIRAGRPPHPSMLPDLPTVLGNGVAGVVCAVGEAADHRLVGARVVTSTGGSGGYAERVSAPADGLILVPAPLTTPDAAALLADGRTAVSILEAADVTPGSRVLVEAAAGGVGTLVVQLAVRAGAHVIATAGGFRKTALARELGAHVAVDHLDPAWPQQVGRRVGQLDIALDGVGGEIGRQALELLGPGGRFLRFGMASGSFTAVNPDELTARGVQLLSPPRPTPERLRAWTERALAEAAAGRLRPVIGQVVGLDRAAEAHAAMEARTTLGKTLLETYGLSEAG